MAQLQLYWTANNGECENYVIFFLGATRRRTEDATRAWVQVGCHCRWNLEGLLGCNTPLQAGTTDWTEGRGEAGLTGSTSLPIGFPPAGEKTKTSSCGKQAWVPCQTQPLMCSPVITSRWFSRDFMEKVKTFYLHIKLSELMKSRGDSWLEMKWKNMIKWMELLS